MDEIKEMYNQLRPKGDFIRAASRKFGVSPITVKAHWMSNEAIPRERQEDVKELLEHILQQQKKYAKSIGL